MTRYPAPGTGPFAGVVNKAGILLRTKAGAEAEGAAVIRIALLHP